MLNVAILIPWLLWPCAASPRKNLLSVGRRSVKSAFLRPIITGCLEECGTEDQSCVTQCEVCVEQNVCPQLQENCSACLDEARLMKERLRKVGDVGADAGGLALQHDGIRQRLQLARMQAMDSTHELRSARDGVLHAQRGVEWAAGETREEIRKFNKTEEHLVDTRKEADRWAERSKAKLAEMRDDRARLRKAENRTMRQLRAANKEIDRAKKELTEAEDLANAGAKIRKVMIIARVVTRLRWKLRTQSDELRKLEDAYKKQKRDSKWFQRGLQKEVEEVARLVKKKVKVVDEAQDMERESRKQLQKAKLDYRRAAEKQQELEATVAELQQELLAHPLPMYVPPEVEEQQSQGDS